MEETGNYEIIKICVEEFSRLQEWMEMTEKESVLYKSMQIRRPFQVLELQKTHCLRRNSLRLGVSLLKSRLDI